MNWAAIVWFALMLVFLAAEASTVQLVSLWFACGALGAMITSFLTPLWGVQVLVFLLISSALLIALRPLARKWLKPKIVRTNVDAVVGSVGLVTEAIDNVSARGQVKLGGVFWTARSASGNPINEGALIRVDRVEGVKVFVSPAEEPARIF